MNDSLPHARFRTKYKVRVHFYKPKQNEKNLLNDSKTNYKYFNFGNEIISALCRYCNNDPGILLHFYDRHGRRREFVTSRTITNPERHYTTTEEREGFHTNAFLKAKTSYKYYFGDRENLFYDAREDFYDDNGYGLMTRKHRVRPQLSIHKLLSYRRFKRRWN